MIVLLAAMLLFLPCWLVCAWSYIKYSKLCFESMYNLIIIKICGVSNKKYFLMISFWFFLGGGAFFNYLLIFMGTFRCIVFILSMFFRHISWQVRLC